MTMQEAERMGREKYPAYDFPKVDPATGKEDCRLTRLWKNAAREAYIKKLLNAGTTATNQ